MEILKIVLCGACFAMALGRYHSFIGKGFWFDLYLGIMWEYAAIRALVLDL